MYQYYIFIVTKTNDNEYSHDVKWAWDADREQAALKAEALYYGELAKAAVSAYAMHSITLMSSDGGYVMSKCYKHPAVPEEV